jgi:hypothetical protein
VNGYKEIICKRRIVMSVTQFVRLSVRTVIRFSAMSLVSLTLMVFFACGTVGPGPTAMANVLSTFDDDAEAWQVVDHTTWGPYSSITATLANPAPYVGPGTGHAGHVAWTDRTGSSFYFQAPTKFSGDMSSLYSFA